MPWLDCEVASAGSGRVTFSPLRVVSSQEVVKPSGDRVTLEEVVLYRRGLRFCSPTLPPFSSLLPEQQIQLHLTLLPRSFPTVMDCVALNCDLKQTLPSVSLSRCDKCHDQNQPGEEGALFHLLT